MRYERLGEIPRKRHVQVRRNGAGSPLLTEEVMGYEGFSGNETILYHLHSPCRLDAVGEFTPIERDEWVPDAHVHRLADSDPVEPGGDPLSGRRLLMFNGDIEVSLCKPIEELDGFYRNGEGDEVIYVHRGGGVLRTVFGRVPFREKDYVVIPRGTTHTFELDDGDEQTGSASTRPARSRRPTATATATACCWSTRPTRSATSTRRRSSRRATRAASTRSPCACATAPGLRARPPPVRRGGLGRLRLALHLQRGRLRAARGPLPPAAARRTRPSRGRTS